MLLVLTLALWTVDAACSLLSAVLVASESPAGAPASPNPRRAVDLHVLLMQDWLVSYSSYLAGVVLPLAVIFLRTAGVAIIVVSALGLLVKLILRRPRRIVTGELFGLLAVVIVTAAAVTAWQHRVATEAAPARSFFAK